MIPLPVQEKILRVVEYGSFERVGGSELIEVDVRIIGATNADLAQMAAQNEFKRDLLDRLSFEVLFLPPLRSRREDIMLLADHFASRMAFELGFDEIPRFSRKVINQFEKYPWKGNIRELKNVVERAVYQSGGGKIDFVVFDPLISPYPFEPLNKVQSSGSDERPRVEVRAAEPVVLDGSFKKSVSKYELKLLRAALERSRFNQRRAAALLDLTYDQFRGLMKKYRASIG